jgi:hypothetical protein
MKLFYSFLIFLVAFTASAQVNFVPGYFVTSDGQRTDCQILVKAEDWRDNPRTFEYRANETVESRAADLSNIVELGFSTGEVFRLIRVDMDRSPDEVSKLKEGRSPEFKSEVLFLRILISGKGTLYQYDEGNLHRFFYGVDKGDVKQLVYKRYMTPNHTVNRLDPKYGLLEVTANEDYKQQLLNELKCKDIDRKDVERLSYSADRLKDFFVKYNECQGAAVATYEKNVRKAWPMHLTIRAGFAQNALSIKNVTIGGGNTTDISGMSTFRVGLEVEGVLPFGEGNWAIPAELSYMPISGQIPQGTVKVEGSTIDILFGLRRYFPVGEKGKLYLTGGGVLANPNATITVVSNLFGMSSTLTMYFAGGFKTDRYSVEFNYNMPRRVLDTGTYEGKFTGYSINLGYRITK